MRLRSAGAAVFLFLLNVYIALPLFHTAYTRQMGSIEAAYIGLARYIAAHFGELTWFPLWYGGIPYPDTYPPLLHWICALAITVTHCDPGLAHHAVTATLYALGPVLLFWMIERLSGSRGAAFVGALGYSVFSPACALVAEIRHDAGGVLAARRLHTLIVYGEGPHLTSLCLLPLAIGLLYLAITKWGRGGAGGGLFLTALGIAAVPLSNWIGAIALAFGGASLMLAFADRWRQWAVAAAVGVWAYAIALPWMSPATIKVIQANAPRVANGFQSDTQQRLYLAGVGVALLVGAYVVRRFVGAPALRFAILFSFLTGATALGKHWFGLSLVPQPERYHLEMDMAFWTLAALLVWPLLASAKARTAAVSVAVIAGLALAIPQHRIARDWGRPIDITTTAEYRTAKWLQANRPGARVFGNGTIGYWLNAFSDNPMITGGFDNGILNPMIPHVIYQVYAGDKQQVMVDLMRAYGVDAVTAGGKDSREVYHPISHFEKFAGMAELWRDGGDAIYDIPRRSRSLAHTITPGGLVQDTPVAYDTTAIQPYLAALDDPAMPPAAFRWLGPDRAVILAGGLRAEHIFSVQISWDKGWSATAGGRPLRTWGDKLGQMVVEPHCEGACEVDLRYDGGTEHRVASWICILALAGGALWTGMAYVTSIRLQRR